MASSPQTSSPGDQVVFEGRMVRLVLKDVRGHRREIVQHAPGAAIVAIDDQQRVLLVKQERPAIGTTLLELPAGIVDEGETPEQTAVRELEEEVGMRAGRIELLARVYTSPGFTDEEIYVYLATELSEGRAHLDEGEDLEVVREPLSALREMLARNEIQDAKTALGLLAYLNRERGR